jgi:hypothetical protein
MAREDLCGKCGGNGGTEDEGLCDECWGTGKKTSSFPDDD